jgi:putrescine aminotransferase
MTYRNYALKQLQQIDAAHHLHPFTDHRDLRGAGSRMIVRADGPFIYDSEGDEILDGMAGLWCVNVGYGRAELAEAAYRQMRELAFYNCFFKTTHPAAAELAARIVELAPPSMGQGRVFFTSSGSEANDTVLRLVRRYWDVMGRPGKKTVIARWNGYHGSTLAGASLGGMKPVHEQAGLPIPGIVHVRQPYWLGEGRDQDPDAFGLACARALEEKILELGPENVAAFIGEPVQGAGGVIIPPASYWPEVQRICRAHDVLLVSDEVICGFGRLGTWFGCQRFGVEPDLMPIAKGLSSGHAPIGGVVIADRVAEPVIEAGGDFHHGYTYSGHPVSCAVAAENLRILKEEGIVDRVRTRTEPYFARRWAELGDHPLVGEARSLGLVGALELVADKATLAPFAKEGETGLLCREHSFKEGLVMRAVRDSMIVSPPLVIGEAEVDDLVRLARRALDLTLDRLRVDLAHAA